MVPSLRNRSRGQAAGLRPNWVRSLTLIVNYSLNGCFSNTFEPP